MFWGCFIYDFKGPYYIYYPETESQKADNADLVEQLNIDEIEAECRKAFDIQEREKERK